MVSHWHAEKVILTAFENLMLVDQIISISKKPSFLSEKFKKLWRAPTTIGFNIFCCNFAHVFYLVIFTKGFAGFFLFCVDLELLIKV